MIAVWKYEGRKDENLFLTCQKYYYYTQVKEHHQTLKRKECGCFFRRNFRKIKDSIELTYSKELRTYVLLQRNFVLYKAGIYNILLLNMQNFEKGHFFYPRVKKFFFCFSWGMKALMPTSQNPWSDLFHLLNSWHYSHPKFKIVNIEVNFWDGPCQLF